MIKSEELEADIQNMDMISFVDKYVAYQFAIYKKWLSLDKLDRDTFLGFVYLKKDLKDETLREHLDRTKKEIGERLKKEFPNLNV